MITVTGNTRVAFSRLGAAFRSIGPHDGYPDGLDFSYMLGKTTFRGKPFTDFISTSILEDETSATGLMGIDETDYSVTIKNHGNDFHLRPVAQYTSKGSIDLKKITNAEVYSVDNRVLRDHINVFTGTKYCPVIQGNDHRVAPKFWSTTRSFVRTWAISSHEYDYGRQGTVRVTAVVELDDWSCDSFYFDCETYVDISIVNAEGTQRNNWWPWHYTSVRDIRIGNYTGRNIPEHVFQEKALELANQAIEDWSAEARDWALKQSFLYSTDTTIFERSPLTKTQKSQIRDTALDACNSMYTDFREHRSKEIMNTHNLSYEALQDVGVCDNNGIAFVKDSLEVGEAFIKFAETLKGLPKSKIKTAASLYLSIHYGWKLMFLDTQEYARYLAENSLNDLRIKRVSAQDIHTFVTGNNLEYRYTGRLHIYYDTESDLQDLIAANARYLDLDLTSENIWDMVPFSFVIDWFFNIGGMLTSLDNFRNVASTYRTVGCCQSLKLQSDISDRLMFLGEHATVDVSAVCYRRMIMDQCPVPIPSSFTKTTSPLAHSVEGASLIVSAI